MGGRPDDDDDGLERGGTVGRYVVLDRLGRGAMGAVYAAYDPELGRRVALKVLRPQVAERQGEDAARRRLLREAQALAKLAHPHVVRIFDVGMTGGRVFLAMELVEGQSLRQWLSEPRGWREAVDMLVQAGQGLAAAHALGLVHRDFKPDNILVDEDGRARVGDFGLARWVEEPDVERSGERAVPLGAGAPMLTAVGDVLGTPAYMAPEQHAGEKADPRSDQYAFCVTLFEVLYGRRPFEQSEAAALEDAKRSTIAVDGGARGATGTVPRSLRALLRQGLAVAPRDRFETMGPLLEIMAQTRSGVGTWRGVAAVLGVVALGAGGVVATGSFEGASTPCTEAGRPPDDAWNAPARRAVEQRLGEHLPSEAIVRTVGALERWSDGWAVAHREACEDTWVRGEQSPARLDARMECLRRQWSELRETVVLLVNADAATAQRSAELVQGLPSPRVCALATSSSEVVRAEGPERESTHDVLARVATLRRAARYDEAWAELAAWEESMTHEGSATAEAAARALTRGQLLEDRGELARSETTYRHALRLAKSAHDDRAEADAWLSLASVSSEHTHDPERARFEARMGMAAAMAAGGDERIDSWAQTLLGSLAFVEGDDVGARVHWERALELRLELYGEDHPANIRAHDGLAQALLATGQPVHAKGHWGRVRELAAEHFPPRHPLLAAPLLGLAEISMADGELELAESLTREALEVVVDDSMDSVVRAQAWWRLALVLEAREVRAEAREAMGTAREHARRGGDDGRELLEQIDAWLGVVPKSSG